MTENLEEFLKNVSYVENDKNGGTGYIVRSINLDKELDVYKIVRFTQQYDDGYVGSYGGTDFYVKREELRPFLEQLAEKGIVELDVKAISDYSHYTYDHTYGREDDCSSSISKIRLKGILKITDSRIDLSEVSGGEAVNLYSNDVVDINRSDKVKEAVRKYLLQK